MANLEVFCLGISSSINFLFLKSAALWYVIVQHIFFTQYLFFMALKFFLASRNFLLRNNFWKILLPGPCLLVLLKSWHLELIWPISHLDNVLKNIGRYVIYFLKQTIIFLNWKFKFYLGISTYLQLVCWLVQQYFLDQWSLLVELGGYSLKEKKFNTYFILATLFYFANTYYLLEINDTHLVELKQSAWKRPKMYFHPRHRNNFQMIFQNQK